MTFLLSSWQSFAQQMNVEGSVVDTSMNSPLQHVVVIAVRFSDSLLTSFTRTNKEGTFKLDSMPVDTYQVILSHPQFGDRDFIIVGSADNRSIDLKKIILPPKSITLREVTVFGYADPVYFRGDTLVYTADSFKVKKNAVVEDLLKKLPGIRVDPDGKIYSQGKKVDQVLVDGDEFFGSDPTIATKNLAANSVESIQVYDKKNENATESSGDDLLKVMNLQLKDDAKKGYFGKTSAAGDFRDYYEGELLVNKFKGKQKISLFALGSNTPRSTFGWNDIYQYGLRDEQNSFTNDDGYMVTYWDNNATDGIPKTLKSGFYYTDVIGKKTKVSLNYTYLKATLVKQTSTASQYFLADTTYRTANTIDSRQQSENQGANLLINQPLDSLTEVELQSKLKYQATDISNDEHNSFLTNEGVLSRTTGIVNSNNGNNLDWNNSVKIARSFKNRDRKFIASYNVGVIRATSDGIHQSNDTYYQDDSLPNDYINQKKILSSNRLLQTGSAIYTEPIGKKIKLEFSYDFSLSSGTQDKKTLDLFNGIYNSENPTLTNNFKSIRDIHRIGTKFTYEVKKYNWSVGTRLREIEASNTNQVTLETISQTTKNILPYMNFRYKFNDNQSFNFRYTTKSTQPDLNQLQPVPDNSNPNFILKGNPDLVPTYSHGFNMAYYAFKPVSGKSMWSNIDFTITNNAFGNSTSYDSLGRTISQTVNVNGSKNLYSFADFSFPFFSRALEFNPYLNYSLTMNSNYVNGLENKTNRSSPEAGLRLRIHVDTLEFSVGGNYAYSSTSSTLNSQSNQSYSYHSYNASFSLEIPWKMKIETDASYALNKQRSQGYNVNTLLWNASLSKKFLKNENLVLSVEATDLLNQNISTSRDVSNNVITDHKTTVIGRYILLKLTFKVNSNKKKDDEGDY